MTRRARVLIGSFAVVVLVVAGAEVAARGLEPYLPAPQSYGDDATATKVVQMDGLGPDCTDVVVVGDSTARDAVDPATFAAADPRGRRLYNASLDAASPETVRRWVLEEVAPRLRPSTVVLPVASLDLNANGPAVRNAARAYDDAVMTRADAAGRVQAAVARRSALVRVRAELRDPANLAGALGRAARGDPAPHPAPEGIAGVVGPGGEGLSRRALLYRGDAATKAFTRDQLLREFRIDPAQIDALRSTVRSLREAGVDVALAAFPVTADYVGLHPGGAADHEAYLEALRQVAATDGVPFVDLHGAEPPPDAFADTHHLNATGARWLTGELARALTADGLDRPARCPR